MAFRGVERRSNPEYGWWMAAPLLAAQGSAPALLLVGRPGGPATLLLGGVGRSSRRGGALRVRVGWDRRASVTSGYVSRGAPVLWGAGRRFRDGPAWPASGVLALGRGKGEAAALAGPAGRGDCGGRRWPPPGAGPCWWGRWRLNGRSLLWESGDPHFGRRRTCGAAARFIAVFQGPGRDG